MTPSISVHEGDSYDPYGPRAEDDQKVKVVTDEATEDMSEEDALKTREGVDQRVLDEAQKKYDEGDGPKVVDLRSDEQKKSPDHRDPTELPTTEEAKDEGEVEPSPGNNSSTSSETTSDSNPKNNEGDPSTVPSADGPSKLDHEDSSTARPVTGRKGLPRRS